MVPKSLQRPKIQTQIVSLIILFDHTIIKNNPSHIRWFYHYHVDLYSLREKWLEIKEAPEPSVILWKNLHIGNTNRFFRTLFVMFVTLVLLAITFAGIVVTKYYQDLASSEYDISGCGSL